MTAKQLVLGLVLLIVAPGISWSDEPLTYSLSQGYEALRDPRVVVKPFPISGTSFSDLRAALDQHGPKDLFGRVRDAFTSWYVSWNWPHDKYGRPQFQRTRADCRITVHLPAWREYPRATPDQQERWRLFLHSVLFHETGHVVLALHHYSTIADRVKRAHSATLTAEKANRIARRFLRKMRQRDIDYDQRTDHGRDQGVLLE